MTLVNQIRKEIFVKQKSLNYLHARCTRSAQITWFEKKLRSLLSWSSAFKLCKNNSKRAIFDVDYQVWKKSFWSFSHFDDSRRANSKKINKLSVNKRKSSFIFSLLIFFSIRSSKNIKILNFWKSFKMLFFQIW